jgi:hypothetical protein
VLWNQAIKNRGGYYSIKEVFISKYWKYWIALSHKFCL